MSSNIVKSMSCPEIAKRHLIITEKNMGSLNLSTYRRTPGTNVSVSCLVPSMFELIGELFITCLPNGQWDKPIPQCIRFKRNPKNVPDIILPNSVTETSKVTTTESLTAQIDNGMAYVISVSVLALMFLCLMFMMIYLVRLRQKFQYRQFETKNTPAFVRAVESMQSIPSLSSTAYDYYRSSGSPTSGSSTRSSRPTGSPRGQNTSRSSSHHAASPFITRSITSNYRHSRDQESEITNIGSIRQFEFGRSLTNI